MRVNHQGLEHNFDLKFDHIIEFMVWVSLSTFYSIGIIL